MIGTQCSLVVICVSLVVKGERSRPCLRASASTLSVVSPSAQVHQCCLCWQSWADCPSSYMPAEMLVSYSAVSSLRSQRKAVSQNVEEALCTP